MKRCIVCFFAVVFACLFAGTAMAQGIDFLEYPEIMHNGSFLVNAGIGYGKSTLDTIKCPPLSVSLDYALPIASLPFTVGAAAVYSSEKNPWISVDNLAFNVRLAYPLGWGIDSFDSYLLAGAGLLLELYDGSSETEPWFWGGAGLRYFFLPWFGAYTELGYGKVYTYSIGVAFVF
jgi:hypothetical protein